MSETQVDMADGTTVTVEEWRGERAFLRRMPPPDCEVSVGVRCGSAAPDRHLVEGLTFFGDAPAEWFRLLDFVRCNRTEPDSEGDR